MHEELRELRIMSQNETLLEKRIKKTIFIFIAIIFPLFEIFEFILHTKNIYIEVEEKEKNNNGFHGEMILPSIILFFQLCSLICTWTMVSVCYLEKRCIIFMLILKIFFIIIILMLCTNLANYNYYYFFNIIGYGLFYLLIIIYNSFKKGII